MFDLIDGWVAETDRTTDMANGDRSERYAATVALLKRDHLLAGEPTFAAIERVSDELEAAGRAVYGVRVVHLARSTANDVMRQVHSRTLRWELVESLWAVMHYIAEREGHDTAAMASREELHRCHHRVASSAASTDAPVTTAVEAATGAQPTTPPPTGLQPVVPGDRGAQGAACGAGLVFADPLAADLGALGDRGPGTSGDPHDAARRLLGRARQHAPTVWWRDYRQVVPEWFSPYLTLEPELSLIRIYAPRRVPGLLQTPAYTRHVIREDLPGTPEHELAQRIELRQLRQQLLRRPDAPRYWAIIDQRALEGRTAPPSVLRGQMKHLITMASFQHVTFQVIRSQDAERIVTAGPVTLMRFLEAGCGDIVYLEQHEHGIYLHDSDDIAYFTLRFHRLADIAMEPHASVGLLLEMLDRLQP